MSANIVVPALGESVTEATVAKWMKSVGDPIKVDEPLLELETDKVTLAVEATVRGTLLEILHCAGESVRVGTLVAYVGEPGEKVPEQAPLQEPAQEAIAGGELPMLSPQRARVTASPAVRRLAQDLGVDLSRVRGSGPDGRIEKEDVLRMTGSPADDG